MTTQIAFDFITRDGAEYAPLPASLGNLAEAIGPEAVLKLVKLYRDRSYVYIPSRIPDGHPISEIGRDAADYLVENYQGERISIPRCTVAVKALRNAEIRRRRRAGEKIANLMHDYDLSSSHLFFILGGKND